MIETDAGGSQSACILNGPHQPVSFSKANTGNIQYSTIILMVSKNNSRAHVTCGDMLPSYVMRLYCIIKLLFTTMLFFFPLTLQKFQL